VAQDATGDIDAATASAGEELLAGGFASVDYVAVRDAETLQPLTDPARPARVLGAAWLGKTRLIDNLAVGG
jgi:pantoate--beta-alanine ligase